MIFKCEEITICMQESWERIGNSDVEYVMWCQKVE
jgi:hypothetical protein